jgi:hypothetical protein
MSTVDKNKTDTEQPQNANDDEVIHKVSPSDELISTQTLQQGATEQPTTVSIEQIDINTQRICAVRNQSSQPSSQTIIGYEKHECLYIAWWIFTAVTGFNLFVGIPCLILFRIVKKRKRAGDFEGARKAWLWRRRVDRVFTFLFNLLLAIIAVVKCVQELNKALYGKQRSM